MRTIHQVWIEHDDRLSIPAEICAKMGLTPSTTVTVEALDAQIITLSIVSDALGIMEENGIRVIASQVDELVDTFLKRDRDARIASVACSLVL